MGCCIPKPRKGGRPYFDNEQTLLFPSVTSQKTQMHSHSERWNATSSLKGSPNLDLLSEKQKKKLSQKWIEIGKAEHASVASFSLFAQRLLAIGAPPDLINEAFECAKEEIEHAKLSFTLASFYADKTIQPQSYESHSFTIVPDVQSIIKGTIHEGCIEETISALETALDIYDEEDEYVKQVLCIITKDEAHHAAFAWKILKWAVECYEDLAESFFEDFDTYLEEYECDDDRKIDIILLGELKNILRNDCTPSDELKSYLESDDERFKNYSKIKNQI